jgi:serine/threonine-protein kinase HipA
LLDYVALGFLVGNRDAHAKNYSLLYTPGSIGATLAPAYDVLSTVVYRKIQPSRRMAMKIGGEYRPDYVESRWGCRTVEQIEAIVAERAGWLAHITAAGRPA